MISEHARQGVDLIFTNAARTNLAMGPSDRVEISPLGGDKLIHLPEPRIAVLTVASYVFRLLTIFHINDDPITTAYFTRSGLNRSLDEAFGEIGNLCCGAMNRELGKHFLHMGMSTPSMLDGKAFAFFRELDPGYVSQHRIHINDTVSMHATLCLCVYAPIDFRVDKSAAQEATGELELF